MNVLPSGTDDITQETVENLSDISSLTVTAPAPLYSNLTITYAQGLIYIFWYYLHNEFAVIKCSWKYFKSSYSCINLFSFR